MSMKELSVELGVTEVTILNFCRAIGIDSYVELKRGFQESMTDALKIPAKMKSSLEDITCVEDAVENTAQIHKNNIVSLLQNNSVTQLDEAASLIQAAKTIYICGQGISDLACRFLQSCLMTLDLDARLVDFENGTLLNGILRTATKEDLFILISFPNFSEKTVRLAEYLGANDHPFIAITTSTDSPISNHARVVLKTDNFSLVFYNFISSTFELLELLLVVLSFKMREELLPSLKNIEEINRFFESSLSKATSKLSKKI